jgi:hypothetical protein
MGRLGSVHAYYGAQRKGREQLQDCHRNQSYAA